MTLAAFPYTEPLHRLAGGILIGLAAAVMLLGAGRIACGVSRLSQRSMLATATFIAAGIGTVIVTAVLS